MLLDDVKVLFVDDEQDIVNVTRACLTAEGARFISAEDGEKGVSLFRENRDVNIIVTDMRMPNKNGAELIKEIREFDLNTPILALSGFSDYSHEEIRDMGGNDYLTKPLPIRTLVDKISELIAH
jgi:two-component system, cell cycle response regulator